MKAYGGVDVYIHILLNSALVGGEWSASRPGRFTPGERTPGTHWIGGWVDITASLDELKRKLLTLPGLELKPLGRPARSQPLYRLRHPGSSTNTVRKRNASKQLTSRGTLLPKQSFTVGVCPDAESS
jgi:hypothetical protein